MLPSTYRRALCSTSVGFYRWSVSIFGLSYPPPTLPTPFRPKNKNLGVFMPEGGDQGSRAEYLRSSEEKHICISVTGGRENGISISLVYMRKQCACLSFLRPGFGTVALSVRDDASVQTRPLGSGRQWPRTQLVPSSGHICTSPVAAPLSLMPLYCCKHQKQRQRDTKARRAQLSCSLQELLARSKTLLSTMLSCSD